LSQSVVPHLVNAQFTGASKAILDASEYSVEVVLVAFELEDNIHDVFQNLWACQCSFLVDVPNE
jgi:hypothetical protein